MFNESVTVIRVFEDGEMVRKYARTIRVVDNYKTVGTTLSIEKLSKVELDKAEYIDIQNPLIVRSRRTRQRMMP